MGGWVGEGGMIHSFFQVSTLSSIRSHMTVNTQNDNMAK